MTALLAFFIALNSLAHEQTGAHLYAGTGAFIRAFSSEGHVGPFRSPLAQNGPTSRTEAVAARIWGEFAHLSRKTVPS